MHRTACSVAMIAIACGLAACVDNGMNARPGIVVASSDAAATAARAKPANVRPQDDMYRAVNGEWLATHDIPADRPAWGAVYQLRDDTLTQLASVIEDAGKAGGGAPNGQRTADQQKIADLYASFIDEPRLEALGVKPIAAQLAAVDAMRSKSAIAFVIAQFNQIGVTAPYSVYIGQDARDSKRYIPTIYQSGLGLPDRDYYLRDDDAKLVDARTKYVAHVARMLALARVPDADAAAKQVLDLETRLARAQWTRVENRDPVKTYNKVPLNRLEASTPHYAWKAWLADARIAGRIVGSPRAVVVAQPSYLAGFAKTVDAMPLAAWKAYFKYHVISAYAPYLSKSFVDEDFAFTGGVLRGTPTDLPRWKRGVETVEGAIGQGLGRLYVAKYFPPASKARMDAMVANILAAYKESIAGLDWMGPATRKQAQAKLAKFDPKIAYPSKWRDYSALVIRRDDLVGNIARARLFEYNRNIAKLGQPIDRTEWGLTPQTVNAYYNGLKNEIVFPAAILQPPFFDAKADDATNYGAIGAVIGHEISHGFDDRGSQFDGDGNLRNWWTDDDRKRFNAKTKALIAQYDAFEAVPGYHVNGALTLGENIADNSGIAIAYKAYRLSLHGKPAPVIDGVSGDARFYRGFAMQWRSKVREPAEIVRIKTDPHSPGEFRANGTLRNQSPFYAAYNVQPGDGMYLAPDKRVTIW